MRAGGFNLYLRFVHCDGFGMFSQFEDGIYQQSAVDIHGYARAPIGPEAGCDDIDIVVADGQSREGVRACAVGHDHSPNPGIGVGCGDRGSRNHRATAVLNGTRNTAAGGRAGQCRKPK